MLHPSDALEGLPEEYCLGPVDPTTLPKPAEKLISEDEKKRKAARELMPVAENILLLQDFEDWAEQVLSRTAWAYYRSAADEDRSKFRPLLHDHGCWLLLNDHGSGGK